MHDAESGAERRRQQPGSRRGADEREFLQRDLDRSRARPLPDHDVHFVVLERGIEDLLHRRRHPVDLVDEQHFTRRQVGDDPDQIARLLDRRARGRTNRHPHLVGDHVGQRGLAQSRRSVEEHVVERFTPLPGGDDRNL